VGQPATAAAVQSTTPAPPAEQSSPASDTQTEAEEAAAAPQPAEEATAPAAPPPEPVELPGRNEALDAALEAELEAALAAGDQSPAGVVPQPAAPAEGAEQSAAAAAALTPDMEVKQGTKLTGTVASIHGDDMFLDFGLRVPGVLSRRQFGLRKQPMQGESLEVVVGRVDENEGLMHVNLPTGTSRVRGEWDALSVDQNVECMVTGTNKGGLEVSIGALRGFMPASQVELGFVPDLNVYIGQRLKARITEVNPKRRKLVLSRRSLLEEEREQSQQELFEKIEPGQQYTGRVRTLKDYGAFVDIGGADGLLHVAQISWSRINHPSEVLKEGEEIQVQVLSVDRDKKKISLGMRQLTQNPWKAAESKFAQGAQVKGKVTRIENFGAFVELDEGVEGLLHISELDHKRVNKVSEVVRIGQEVEVQVLEVDPKRKRVSLSLKALKEKPEDVQEKQEAAPIKRQRSVDSLVGGIGEPTGGQLFGDPSKFGR
jgi:ribosomal protein S1